MYDFEKLDPLAPPDNQGLRRRHARGIRVLRWTWTTTPADSSVYAGHQDRRRHALDPRGEGNREVDPVTCAAVGGLPDLRTELPEVRDYLPGANIALAKKERRRRGFRLDAC